MLLLLILPGIVAPPYHLNQYLKYLYIKLRVLHMLDVVVPVLLIFIVVSLLLLYSIRLLGLAGTMAQSYHLNYVFLL